MRTADSGQRTAAISVQNQDNSIHVVLAIHDASGKYTQHAGVAVTSIFEKTSRKITVHIFHDETLSEENKQKFMMTAEKYSQTIELHDVADYRKYISPRTSKFFVSMYTTVGGLYRLLIPDILSTNKAIYLDSDIVVNLDIAELWNIDVDDCCIAARFGRAARGWEEFIREKLCGCDTNAYINSGVMVMNLKAIRAKCNLYQDALKWIDCHLHLLRYGDQDAISSLMRNSMKPLDIRFNRVRPDPIQTLENSILHSAGFPKSWETNGCPHQELYWNIYLISVWGENCSREELIHTIQSYAKPFVRNKRLPLWKRLIHKFYYNTPAKIFRLVVKDMLYRLKYRLARP